MHLQFTCMWNIFILTVYSLNTFLISGFVHYYNINTYQLIKKPKSRIYSTSSRGIIKDHKKGVINCDQKETPRRILKKCFCIQNSKSLTILEKRFKAENYFFISFILFIYYAPLFCRIIQEFVLSMYMLLFKLTHDVLKHPCQEEGCTMAFINNSKESRQLKKFP